MAFRRWAGYIALHPVMVSTDHQSLLPWLKEHLDISSGPASCRARLHETLAEFGPTLVYFRGKGQHRGGLSQQVVQQGHDKRLCPWR